MVKLAFKSSHSIAHILHIIVLCCQNQRELCCATLEGDQWNLQHWTEPDNLNLGQKSDICVFPWYLSNPTTSIKSLNFTNIYFLSVNNSHPEGLKSPLNSAHSKGGKVTGMVEKLLFQEPGVKGSNPGSVPGCSATLIRTQGSLGFCFTTCKLRVFKAES